MYDGLMALGLVTRYMYVRYMYTYASSQAECTRACTCVCVCVQDWLKEEPRSMKFMDITDMLIVRPPSPH